MQALTLTHDITCPMHEFYSLDWFLCDILCRGYKPLLKKHGYAFTQQWLGIPPSANAAALRTRVRTMKGTMKYTMKPSPLIDLFPHVTSI